MGWREEITGRDMGIRGDMGDGDKPRRNMTECFRFGGSDLVQLVRS